jgi:stage III sporulation protein AG
VVSSGGSVESPVTLKTVYPEYLGALVVCEGADNPTVAYQIVKAVAGLTGLGTDKIVVSKMNES